MKHSQIENGGLGQRGTSTDQTRSAYDNYNSYRGDMENARKKADDTFSDSRLEASATMTADGITRNGPEWNKTMTDIQTKFDSSVKEASDTFEQYKSSDEYMSLVDKFNKGTAFDKSQGMVEDVFNKAKPTFDEFFDMQFGSKDKVNRATVTSQQRRQNAISGGVS